MRTKLQEAAEQADEPNHTAIENGAELKAKPQESVATAKRVKQVIDKLELEALIEQLGEDWKNSGLSTLVNDQKFMKRLEKICRSLTGRYQTSPSYSWDDLSQDVIMHLVKAMPLCQPESVSLPYLRKITKNQLIDVHRKRDNQCVPIDDTRLQGRNGDEYERDGEELEGGELADRYGETHQNREEDQLIRSIRVAKAIDMLPAKQRAVCLKYFFERLTMDDIADECGISKQAVCAQIGRVKKKLQELLR
jgi:RNA polymerase sigma factor (sigma-70 family)